jgi:hypothetical protein
MSSGPSRPVTWEIIDKVYFFTQSVFNLCLASPQKFTLPSKSVYLLGRQLCRVRGSSRILSPYYFKNDRRHASPLPSPDWKSIFKGT